MKRLTLIAAVVLLVVAHAAVAKRPAVHNTIAAASNPTLGQMIIVDGHGKTAYRLDPETTSNLLCKSASCLGTWRPVTEVSKAKLHAGRGVKGKLGLIHRAHGVLQVTLRGLPLYTYTGDGPGDANGEGAQTFGGTWKALSAASGSGIAPPGQSTSPGPTTPGNGPGYTPPYVPPYHY